MGFWEFTIGDAAGIGLSVAGFGVAGWQLWRTKRAVDAAREGYEAAMAAVARSQNDEEAALLTLRLTDASAAVEKGDWSAARALVEDSIATLARINMRSHRAFPRRPDGPYDEIIVQLEEVREACARPRPPGRTVAAELLGLLHQSRLGIGANTEALRYDILSEDADD